MTIKRIAAHIYHRLNISSAEQLLAINWYNPFATIWLNFRSFPLRQAWKLPIAVYGRPRIFNLSGKMEIISGVKVRFGMISFNKSLPASPGYVGNHSQISNQGKIIFNGTGFIGTGDKLVIYPNAKLDLGENFKIADSVNLTCSREVKIGKQSRIAHRSQIIDTNNHYINKLGVVNPILNKISIGDYCWICNSTTVTGGSVIPDLSIVGSNSLVNRDFSNLPIESLIAGVPAKHITTGLRRIDSKKWINVLGEYFKNNPDTPYQLPGDIEKDELSRI